MQAMNFKGGQGSHFYIAKAKRMDKNFITN
jgi:hypothetical protein